MNHQRPIHYAGSIVLGLNDALVEITGALAGMTLAFQDTGVVFVAGLVTGIAASLSMAASEFLEAKQDRQDGMDKHPVTGAMYTGSAYLFATLLLLLPYLLTDVPFYALGGTVTVAVLIIAVFTRYVSKKRKQRWGPQFFQMAAISLGVAAISFVIGSLLRGQLT